MLGVRLDDDLEKRLTALAERTHHSKSHLAKIALRRYIEQEEQRDIAGKETLARWESYQETGEVIGNDSVAEWLDSWGENTEKPCPVK